MIRRAAVLDLRRLHLLRELDRLGTIAAVAEAVSYSPSAVSQQLATLERETGVVLLEAAGRRVRLTEQGKVLVEHAAGLLTAAEQAEAALARSLHEPSGVVRVAGFQSAVLTLLPAVLTDLSASHPALEVQVTELEPEASLPALAAGQFDLVLGEEYPGHPLPLHSGLTRTPLMDDPLFLVSPRGWPRSLTRLAAHPFILEPPGTSARAWAETLCRTAGFEPNVQHTTSDLQIHLRFVQEGLAAALLPGLAIDEAVGVRRRISGNPVRHIFTATRSGSEERPTIQAVLHQLRSVVKAV